MSGTDLAQARPVPKGTVLFREKDRGGQMYIILKGSVTLTMNCNGRIAKLAEVTQGGFFGEMSLLEGLPHSTGAIASSDSILLVVTKDNFSKFIMENPEIAVKIMKGLSERVRKLNKLLQDSDDLETYQGLSQDKGECVQKDVTIPSGGGDGANLSAEPVKDAEVSVYSGMEISKDTIMQYLLTKEMTCPVCGSKFKYLWLRDSKLKQISRTTELRVTYQHIEPIFHDLCVCPECYFTRPRNDFSQITPMEKKTLEENTGPRKEKYSLRFNDLPDWGFVIDTYKLAIECYCGRPMGKTEDKIAGLWMRLAWIMEDLGEEVQAQEARAAAVEKYKSAYAMGTGSEDNDHKVEYLVGRIAHSLGKIKDARDYMFKAATRRNGHKMIQQMARDELEALKEAHDNEQDKDSAKE